MQNDVRREMHVKGRNHLEYVVQVDGKLLTDECKGVRWLGWAAEDKIKLRSLANRAILLEFHTKASTFPSAT
jgi:hypothetical protein